MIADQSAFTALSAARKSAKGAGDKDPAFAAALLACIRIPQAIAATGGAMLELCERVLPVANKFLLSDLAVCAELSMATVRCAAYNAYVNLADVSDPGERQRCDQATGDVLAHATPRIRALVPIVRSKRGSNHMRDDRDYKLELSSPPESTAVKGTRPFLSVQFACYNVYSRIYRDLDDAKYQGRCPRCGRSITFVVGEGGTDQRFFVVR